MRCGVAAALVLAPMALAAPKIWMFTGDPGDQEHHQRFEKQLTEWRRIFQRTYGVSAADMKVFYGPLDAGYHGVCTKETLLAELKEAAAATRDGHEVWLIFQGHGNTIPGGALFNLPGPDASAREISEALETASPDTPMVVFVTMAGSENYLRPLAVPGRVVVTANSKGDPENENDFPLAFTAALEERESDLDGDGILSVTELFRACHARIEAMATSKGYMIREHAQMDGNGDGRGSRRPALADAEPASRIGLRIGGGAADGAPPDFD